jgi:Pathogenicity locus
MAYRKNAMTTMNLQRRKAPERVVKELSRIPGVGPSIASDLCQLGVHEIADLRGRNPESLYADLCQRLGQPVDRCVLYVFRCAVYYASEPEHDPERLKWWNWKD